MVLPFKLKISLWISGAALLAGRVAGGHDDGRDYQENDGEKLIFHRGYLWIKRFMKGFIISYKDNQCPSQTRISAWKSTENDIP